MELGTWFDQIWWSVTLLSIRASCDGSASWIRDTYEKRSHLKLRDNKEDRYEWVIYAIYMHACKCSMQLLNTNLKIFWGKRCLTHLRKRDTCNQKQKQNVILGSSHQNCQQQYAYFFEAFYQTPYISFLKKIINFRRSNCAFTLLEIERS